MKVKIVDEKEFIDYMVNERGSLSQHGQAVSFVVDAVRHEDKITISLTSMMPIKREKWKSTKEHRGMH